MSNHTHTELLIFIGCLYLHCVSKKHKICLSKVWTKDSPNYMKLTVFSVSSDKFYAILKYFAFYDIRASIHSSDKFYKMLFAFSQFKCKILTAIQLHCCLCVDEELYPFKSNPHFRQYIPSKPAKYSLKYRCVCDVKTWYFCNVDICLWKFSDRTVPVGESINNSALSLFFASNSRKTTDNSLHRCNWKTGITNCLTLRNNQLHLPINVQASSSITV